MESIALFSLSSLPTHISLSLPSWPFLICWCGHVSAPTHLISHYIFFTGNIIHSISSFSCHLWPFSIKVPGIPPAPSTLSKVQQCGGIIDVFFSYLHLPRQQHLSSHLTPAGKSLPGLNMQQEKPKPSSLHLKTLHRLASVCFSAPFLATACTPVSPHYLLNKFLSLCASIHAFSWTPCLSFHLPGDFLINFKVQIK